MGPKRLHRWIRNLRLYNKRLWMAMVLNEKPRRFGEGRGFQGTE